MPKFYSKKETIRRLKRLQDWRLGKIDNFSKKNRVPPPKMITKIIDSALYYLEHDEVDVWMPGNEPHN